MRFAGAVLIGLWVAASSGGQDSDRLRQLSPGPSGLRAFTGATLIDGTGAPPVRDAVLVIRDDRVIAVGPAGTISVPRAAERVDVEGRTIVPGFVNAHGHVGMADGLQTGPAVNTEENVRRQLGLYARYGVTTVVSLGEDGAAGFRVREANDRPELDRARLYVAGEVIDARTPEQARTVVDAAAARKPDWIKIRVDDNLGTTGKMPPEVFEAVIRQAHARGLRVAAHIFYLADAKALLRAGVDFIAHSIRDAEVDEELIGLLKARDVCVSPTLMREVSTFVYASRPAFFDDPFFRREADPKVVATLEDGERQQKVAASRPAKQYREALEIARRNARILQDANVRLAFGTDTGPPGRFQGYFEHLELEELVTSGLTPAQALRSATGIAAACMGVSNRVGTLAPGRYADFIVLAGNPLEDIRRTRTVESVWISGNRVPRQ